MTSTDGGLDDTVAGDTVVAPAKAGERGEPEAAHWERGREIARGGMGRVVEAQDRRLGRAVAIKELLTQDPGLVARFEREARLTARLQHPAIVPVYEAGRSAAGEPFLAMKKVDGKDLERVIAETRTLGERMALLPNVLAVADAVAYAHARGVIHRDLKPRNVLVGEFGETVVIDWGLAKELDEHTSLAGPDRTVVSAGETVAGSVMGTPAYMPPEQAAGEQVDARADVYSLGALLHHVLAGRAPYAGEVTGEILEQVLRKGPRPLDEVASGVPVDLLAIVRKAMARAPADRYANARELADDLRRFQTGQLVGVHRYTAAQLLRRWLRRYRVAVVVAGVAAAVLVVVGVVSVRRIMRAQDHAEAERALAEQHRKDAEELMEFMLFDLQQQLRPIGKLDLLDAPARKAVAYYRDRPLVRGPDEAHRRATALTNLGEVLRARGDARAALAEYREAEHLLEGAEDAVSRRALAVTQQRIGDALEDLDDDAGTLTAYRASLAIFEQLAAAAPEDPMAQRDLSVAHERLGNAFATQDAAAAAVAAYRAALEVRSRLAAAAPEDPEAQRDLSVAHAKLGELLEAHDDLPGALIEYRADLAIAAQLAAAAPDNAEWQRDLSVSQINVGSVLARRGDLAGALAADQAALGIRTRLAAQDPSNVSWVRDLAVAHDEVAGVLVEQGQLEAALAERRAALAGFTRVAAQRPDESADQEVAGSHYLIGEILVAQHDLDAARTEYRAALEIVERLLAAHPTSPEAKENVDDVKAAIAACCAR